jgi:transposase
MKHILGKDRNQIEILSLNELIAQDNEVRTIDLFVDSLDLQQFGFRVDFGENGRPAYRPGDLLRLYLYGYLNRNIELMWLMRGLTPDHNTISNFRKNNPLAIQKVFRATS